MSGIVKICKEGKSAIKARLAELTELGYLVRTQLKSNESKSRGFEYIYEFFEIALSKEDAEKKSEKTRKNAKKSVKDLFPTRLPDGQEKSKKSAKKGADTSKKQHSGFRFAENPSAEKTQAEKQAQLNTNEKINKNKKFSDKESISPSAPQKKIRKKFQQSFNVEHVEKSADERMIDEYTQKFEIYKGIIKQNINFYEFASWLDQYCDDDEDGWAEAEQIVEAMVRQVLSTKSYEVIHGQKMPRASVQSVMLKANIYHMENVVEQMKEVLNIRNYEAYLISSVYNEVVNFHVKKNAESRAISYDIRQTFGY